MNHIIKIVDGTYFRKYGDEEINLCFLGSDIEKCPYYLNSVDQIMENENIAIDYYASYINREYEDVYVDERIHNNSEEITWLHFSDCMNNGGTSQLFIDFTPSDTGKKGQVIRCIQDPDKLVVIADSFDEYLRNIICNKFDFIETMADVETSIKIEEKKKRFSFRRLFSKKDKGLS